MLGTETDTHAATRPAPARRVGPRLFATTADVPRARRASDVIALVAAGFGLAGAGVADEPPSGVARSLSSFVAAPPHALDGPWQALAGVLVVLPVVLPAAAGLRRRQPTAPDIVIPVAVAAALSVVAGRLVEGSWPALWDALRTADPPPWFPSSRLALPTAAVITASPHVSLPVRRLGRRSVALAAFGVMVLGAATPLGALGAVLVATMAAAAVHLAFGSTEGRPSLGLVRAALVEGRVDGTLYEGECACLIGTIAMARGCRSTDLGIAPDNERPAERFAISIRPGDTPEDHPTAALIVQWIDEWTADRAGAL